MKEKYFTHINCPNCGASMTLRPGYAWECEHCGTVFYVLPAHKVDMICTKKFVDEDFCDSLSEVSKNDFFEHIDRDVAENVGNYLLNKGYIEKKKVKDITIIPDGIATYLYTLRVVSLDKEQEDKNSL